MKKFLASILICLTAVCSLASCEDNYSSSSNISSSSSAISSAVDDNDTPSKLEKNIPESSERESNTAMYAGKWQGIELSYNGTKMDNLFGLPVYALVQFEINEDGTIFSEAGGEHLEGTWEITGERKISMSMNGETSDFEYKNSELVLEQSKMGITVEFRLEKVDEFTEFDISEWQDNFNLGDMLEGLDLNGKAKNAFEKVTENVDVDGIIGTIDVNGIIDEFEENKDNFSQKTIDAIEKASEVLEYTSDNIDLNSILRNIDLDKIPNIKR